MLTRAVALHIPPGLGALLAKLGLQAPTDEAQLGQLLKGGQLGADAKGLTALGKEGLPKGMELGPDGELLSGLGYNSADKESPQKNANEKTNVERFVHESSVERAEQDNPFTNLGREAKESRETEQKETKDKTTEQTETADRRDAKEGDVRREEAKEDARVVGQQEAEMKETAERRDVEEAEARDRQQEREDDEEDKPGAGWVAEEFEEEEAKHKRGLRDADVMGDVHRCKGTLDDGTGCLRKPLKGTPYCREHAAHWRLRPPIGKA